MKYLLKTVVVVSLVFCAAVAFAQGPFGFEKGMTKEQIVSRLGAGAIKQVRPTGMVIFSTAPKPHPMFTEYSAIFSPTDGLLKIGAFSGPITTSADGTEIKQQFRDIKAALVAIYGPPTNDFNFLKAGSLWKDDSEFAMALVQEERVLSASWINVNKNGVQSLMLNARGLSRREAMLSLSYEFSGFEQFSEQKKAKADKVF